MQNMYIIKILSKHIEYNDVNIIPKSISREYNDILNICRILITHTYTAQIMIIR